jgi:hypothetical protein
MVARRPRIRGEIYIGVIIAMGIFVILSQAIIFLSSTAYELIGFTRARATGQLLVNEKIETLRNLPFANVGTTGGIPSGPLPASEYVDRNGLRYTVTTTVIYVDDPFDGVAPTDLTPNDYKRARVQVTWSGIGRGSASITGTTDIAPKGVEQSLGGGTLSILVFDSSGVPVPQATVTIKAPTASPAVNLTITTNDNGRIVLPGAPACSSCYNITATKSGYSIDSTYTTAQVANPARPPLTVLSGKLTETSFAIDQTATVNLTSVDSRQNNFATLGSQTFWIRGGKTIGTTTLDVPVYKYDQAITTSAAGTLTLSNMEWDTYTITTATASARVRSGSNALLPITLLPAANTNLSISLASKTTNTLLIAFIDDAKNLIASVSAQISSGAYVATASAGLTSDPDVGHVFFSLPSSGTYTVTASASGYQPTTTNISVSGNREDTVTLSP